MGQSLLVQITSSCKDPWHLWHCVQSLENFSSNAENCPICFWYIALSLGLQCSHTASDSCFKGTYGRVNVLINYPLMYVHYVKNREVNESNVLFRSPTLHPIHFDVFFVNAANALTLDVTTVFVRVWSPLSSVDSALVSPQIGSKSRSRGFCNCCLR